MKKSRRRTLMCTAPAFQFLSAGAFTLSDIKLCFDNACPVMPSFSPSCSRVKAHALLYSDIFSPMGLFIALTIKIIFVMEV